MSTCPFCQFTWSGHSSGHCRFKYPDGHRCCAHFSRYSSFDKHWKGTQHLDPKSVPGLIQDGRGVWRQIVAPERLAQLAKLRPKSKRLEESTQNPTTGLGAPTVAPEK